MEREREKENGKERKKEKRKKKLGVRDPWKSPFFYRWAMGRLVGVATALVEM